MSLEEFARIRHLGSAWIELRRDCNRIVERPGSWYRKDLQDSARKLAMEASDILTASIKGDSRK